MQEEEMHEVFFKMNNRIKSFITELIASLITLWIFNV